MLVPTRELALQIYQEAKKYSKVYNISVICAYGGGNKYEQSKAFEAGAELVIAVEGDQRLFVGVEGAVSLDPGD